MREIETLIVGGGPGGSSCAGELLRHGRECLVLRRKVERPKLCAGWVTPKVLRNLGIRPEDYPHGIRSLRRIRLRLGRRHRLGVTLCTEQYSIRRVEFDAWLLARSGVEVADHTVRRIRREGDSYVVDDAFRCRHLVGAGGTACPVRRTFFPDNRGRLIITREVEYTSETCPEVCTIWFPFAGSTGYAWCVPKVGAVNVGFGVLHEQLGGRSLKALWRQFVALLGREGCIDADPPEPRGHPYRVGEGDMCVKREGAYLVGDAAALATMDLAEGIGPAIESGTLAARDILGLEEYSAERITRYSLGPLARPMVRILRRLMSIHS